MVLQFEEEGVMSAVVEMRCGAAYNYKYHLSDWEGRPLNNLRRGQGSYPILKEGAHPWQIE